MSNSNGWFQHLLAPLIVGVIVLLGQSIVQPFVAEKVNAKTKRWDTKREAFLDVLDVVDKQITAYADVPNILLQKGIPPNANEINRAYDKLVLFADDRNIIEAFLSCFGAKSGQKVVHHKDRIRLMQLMRAELGFGKLNLTSDDVMFWIKRGNP